MDTNTIHDIDGHRWTIITALRCQVADLNEFLEQIEDAHEPSGLVANWDAVRALFTQSRDECQRVASLLEEHEGTLALIEEV